MKMMKREVTKNLTCLYHPPTHTRGVGSANTFCDVFFFLCEAKNVGAHRFRFLFFQKIRFSAPTTHHTYIQRTRTHISTHTRT
jgi:hypothetical protein